jgi:hypothetical protein
MCTVESIVMFEICTLVLLKMQVFWDVMSLGKSSWSHSLRRASWNTLALEMEVLVQSFETLGTVFSRDKT